MKTVHEILDEISPMMKKNKISGFSVAKFHGVETNEEDEQ